MRVLAAAYSKMGESTKAEYTLKIANGHAPEIGRWKDWLSNAFEDPAILQPLFDEIESIN
jgi:hypothetical protein